MLFSAFCSCFSVFQRIMKVRKDPKHHRVKPLTKHLQFSQIISWFFSIILSAITFFHLQFQPFSCSFLFHLPVVEKSVIHPSSLEMNAGENAGMVLRAETAQSYLQESLTWRTKQGTKLRRRPMVLERNRQHFVLFCF